MREFYIKDKRNNCAIRGVMPGNDLDWPPFDYFRYGHALNFSKIFGDTLKERCPIAIPEKLINKFVFNMVDEKILNMLNNSLVTMIC